MRSYSARFRRDAAPIWEEQHDHPFVRGIGDGTLEPGKFRHYVRQDYVFLIDYGRLLALASARAPRLELQQRFAELARSTLVDEMALHRSYAAEWGIAREELEAEPASSATRAYADFLLRTAALGDFAELVSALLPCLWGYSEIGRRLADGGRPGNELYARWIETYADPAFARLAGWCREICDEVAADSGLTGRARMEAAFVESSRHELAFWQACWEHRDAT
jgi:thiaminase/transcriptional activator TenA